MVLALVATTGCGRPPNRGGDGAAVGNTGAGAAQYPSLATVPPRPRLTYDVEQRRAIEGELVRDRENAGRLAAAIDHELGRGPAPPPAAPGVGSTVSAAPSTLAAVAGDRLRGPGDDPLVEAYVKEATARDEDRGKLKDFFKNLERPAPGTGTPAPSAAAALGLEELVPPIDEAGSAPMSGSTAAVPTPDRPRSEALTRFGDQLGGILGIDGAPPAPTLVARVPFAPGGAELPPSAEAELGRALAAAREAGGGLRIVAGGGRDGTLGIDRARAVAAALTRLGASAGELDVAEGGGTGDEARVNLVTPSPRS